MALIGADLVPGAGRDQDRIPRYDGPPLAVELHLARALDQVVDLLALAVVVALRRASRPGSVASGEALVTRGRVGNPSSSRIVEPSFVVVRF